MASSLGSAPLPAPTHVNEDERGSLHAPNHATKKLFEPGMESNIGRGGENAATDTTAMPSPSAKESIVHGSQSLKEDHDVGRTKTQQVNACSGSTTRAAETLSSKNATTTINAGDEGNHQRQQGESATLENGVVVETSKAASSSAKLTTSSISKPVNEQEVQGFEGGHTNQSEKSYSAAVASAPPPIGTKPGILSSSADGSQREAAIELREKTMVVVRVPAKRTIPAQSGTSVSEYASGGADTSTLKVTPQAEKDEKESAPTAEAQHRTESKTPSTTNTQEDETMAGTHDDDDGTKQKTAASKRSTTAKTKSKSQNSRSSRSSDNELWDSSHQEHNDQLHDQLHNQANRHPMRMMTTRRQHRMSYHYIHKEFQRHRSSSPGGESPSSPPPPNSNMTEMLPPPTWGPPVPGYAPHAGAPQFFPYPYGPPGPMPPQHHPGHYVVMVAGPPWGMCGPGVEPHHSSLPPYYYGHHDHNSYTPRPPPTAKQPSVHRAAVPKQDTAGTADSEDAQNDGQQRKGRHSTSTSRTRQKQKQSEQEELTGTQEQNVSERAVISDKITKQRKPSELPQSEAKKKTPTAAANSTSSTESGKSAKDSLHLKDDQDVTVDSNTGTAAIEIKEAATTNAGDQGDDNENKKNIHAMEDLQPKEIYPSGDQQTDSKIMKKRRRSNTSDLSVKEKKQPEHQGELAKYPVLRKGLAIRSRNDPSEQPEQFPQLFQTEAKHTASLTTAAVPPDTRMMGNPLHHTNAHTVAGRVAADRNDKISAATRDTEYATKHDDQDGIKNATEELLLAKRRAPQQKDIRTEDTKPIISKEINAQAAKERKQNYFRLANSKAAAAMQNAGSENMLPATKTRTDLVKEFHPQRSDLRKSSKKHKTDNGMGSEASLEGRCSVSLRANASPVLSSNVGMASYQVESNTEGDQGRESLCRVKDVKNNDTQLSFHRTVTGYSLFVQKHLSKQSRNTSSRSSSSKTTATHNRDDRLNVSDENESAPASLMFQRGRNIDNMSLVAQQWAQTTSRQRKQWQKRAEQLTALAAAAQEERQDWSLPTAVLDADSRAPPIGWMRSGGSSVSKEDDSRTESSCSIQELQHRIENRKRKKAKIQRQRGTMSNTADIPMASGGNRNGDGDNVGTEDHVNLCDNYNFYSQCQQQQKKSKKRKRAKEPQKYKPDMNSDDTNRSSTDPSSAFSVINGIDGYNDDNRENDNDDAQLPKSTQAIQLFQSDYYPVIKARYPNLTDSELKAELSRHWKKSRGQAERQFYTRRAQEMRRALKEKLQRQAQIARQQTQLLYNRDPYMQNERRHDDANGRNQGDAVPVAKNTHVSCARNSPICIDTDDEDDACGKSEYDNSLQQNLKQRKQEQALPKASHDTGTQRGVPRPPGRPPTGKMWDCEDGKWADMPQAQKQKQKQEMRRISKREMSNGSCSILHKRPVGPAPTGKLWDPVQGTWVDCPDALAATICKRKGRLESSKTAESAMIATGRRKPTMATTQADGSGQDHYKQEHLEASQDSRIGDSYTRDDGDSVDGLPLGQDPPSTDDYELQPAADSTSCSLLQQQKLIGRADDSDAQHLLDTDSGCLVRGYVASSRFELEAKEEGRLRADGCIISKQTLVRDPVDFSFKQPNEYDKVKYSEANSAQHRSPPGYDWCPQRGLWVPTVQRYVACGTCVSCAMERDCGTCLTCQNNHRGSIYRPCRLKICVSPKRLPALKK
ncbi:hypothetical protein ACA910_001153 [Epithemia clementina (nom. ined.)]